MLRKRLVVTIEISILTVIVGVLTNIATGDSWKQWTWLAWLLLISCVIATVTLTIRQVLLEKANITSFGSPIFRKRMLDKVEWFWIKGVLEQSLYRIARLELEIEYNNDMIECPWDSIVQRPGRGFERIPSYIPILQIFEDLGEEVLILGEPGSGKTTTLLELTRDLLSKAQNNENYPIPVVFNLSSWANRRLPIASWMIEELINKYDVPRWLSREWVEQEKIIPLLDGLDEVRSEYRLDCLVFVNNYRIEFGLMPIAVCCRSQEYNDLLRRSEYKSKLRLNAAILIQPLELVQVKLYLNKLGSSFDLISKAIEEDVDFADLVRTPLMLSIIALAYKDVQSKDMVKQFEQIDKVGTSGLYSQSEKSISYDKYYWQLRMVFDAYIEAMFRRRATSHTYTQQQTVQYLSWLASRMSTQGQAIFYIEQLQLKWAGVFSLKVSLVIAIVVGILHTLFFGSFIALLCGFIFLVLWSLPDDATDRGEIPNQGMHRKITQATFGGLCGCFAGFVLNIFFLNSFNIGLMSVLAFWGFALFGGITFLQHISVRLLLYQLELFPWSCFKFLEYATDRIFLRKVGNSYIL